MTLQVNGYSVVEGRPYRHTYDIKHRLDTPNRIRRNHLRLSSLKVSGLASRHNFLLNPLNAVSFSHALFQTEILLLLFFLVLA